MDSSSSSSGVEQPKVRMFKVRDIFAPRAPSSFADCGLNNENLVGLAIKHAFTVQQFTTEWMIEQLALPQAFVMELLESLRAEKLIEVRGEAGALSYLYTISGKGREQAIRLMEISGYVGPVPVSLEAYTTNLDWQVDNFMEVSQENMEAALSELILGDDAKTVIGLTLTSGRSLLIHGPPGNGKTSVGRMLHDAYTGHLWIPHAIAVENSIIRLFDPALHIPAPPELSFEEDRYVDQRFIRIKRPFVVVGGELTMEGLDLGYDEGLKYYEAPLHLKANGGTFLLDDFGRQRVEPSQLLNRWIIPLEMQTDYLTLKSGQKLKIPVRQTLAISTGLNPDDVIDPAFMRRLGYRLHLDNPTAENYRRIFERYVAQQGDEVAPGAIDHVLARYEAEERSLRSSEPSELIERARDICRYQKRPMILNEETMDLAWKGFFGERQEGEHTLGYH